MPEEAKCSIIEEYARFLAAITPKIGDSVKEIREFRDAETEDEFLARMKRREGLECQTHTFEIVNTTGLSDRKF